MNQATLELLVTLKDNASSGLGSIGGALGNVGMIAGGAALAGVAALGAAIVGGAKDALDARALYASTAQTIETMGNAAGRSADDVVALASSLSDAAGMSLFGDDQIQSAENLLLTFGEIKGETFDLATALTVDLAQALGGEPRDQAMMLGKALNDPIHGMTALGKAGLTFTEQQKEQIKVLQESGDMAGAQAIIIAELNKQVGGQAQAAAKAAGGMVQFQASMGETFETIGAELLPILDELGAWLSSPEVQEAIKTFSTNLANGIRIAAAWLKDTLIPAVKDFWNWLGPILMPILAELGRALMEDLPRGIERVQNAWMALKQALSDFNENYIQPIVRGWNAIISAVETAYDWFVKIGNALPSIQIPAWLQGHSPPPLANWFSDIADAADLAGSTVNTVAPPGGAVPALPAMPAGATGGITVNVTVQGSVTTERDLVRAIRDGLNQIGMQNTSIFSPQVTP